MIKYKTGGWQVKIKEVEVDKETEKCVWIRGRRNSKLSSYESYFDSFSDAKVFLINRKERRISKLQSSLDIVKKELAEIVDLTA